MPSLSFIEVIINLYVNVSVVGLPKGQLISKYPFGVFKSPKKNNGIFSRISSLASKKRSNQKSSVRESK